MSALVDEIEAQLSEVPFDQRTWILTQLFDRAYRNRGVSSATVIIGSNGPLLSLAVPSPELLRDVDPKLAELIDESLPQMRAENRETISVDEMFSGLRKEFGLMKSQTPVLANG